MPYPLCRFAIATTAEPTVDAVAEQSPFMLGRTIARRSR